MRPSVILLALALLVPAARLAVADDPAERPNVDPAIQKLVDDLSSDDFRVRERASHELEQKGEAAREALAWTVEHDESLEARFRAQQLLRRLDGSAARPLDEPEHLGLEEEGEAERLARELERFLGEDRLDPFFRRGFALGTVRAPGLSLVPEGFGRFRLEVETKNEAGVPGEPQVFRGRSLEAIVAEHPELAEHPGLAELEAKIKDPFKQLEDLFKGGTIRTFPGLSGSAFESVMVVNGVEVRQTPEQTTVKFTEKDENGNDVERTFTGKDLEEIKREHPEIAKRLEGFRHLRFGFTPPQIFRGQNSPFGGRRPAVTPSKEGPVLGVRVETPQEALAYHLGFEPGHGAIVRLVEPGSQAERLGFERNDIILRINETPVTGLPVVTRLFREAAETGGPLTVEIIRRGKPEVLSR